MRIQPAVESEFIEAIRELQSTVSTIEGAVFTSSALTVALSTIYPIEAVSPSEESANLARPLPADGLPSFTVNSDIPVSVSQSMPTQAALAAIPDRESRDARYQRRNDRRDAQPALAERVSERTSPAGYVRTPLKSHFPYTESAGTAKVQPNLKTLEALMRQLQSTMAHLKKDDQSSDSQQIKVYHASVDTPDTEYALHASDEHTLSSDTDIVHGSGWALPPPRTNPSHYFRGHDDSD